MAAPAAPVLPPRLSLYTAAKVANGYAWTKATATFLPDYAWEHTTRGLQLFAVSYEPIEDGRKVRAVIDVALAVRPDPISISDAGIDTNAFTLRFGRRLGNNIFTCNRYLHKITRHYRRLPNEEYHWRLDNKRVTPVTWQNATIIVKLVGGHDYDGIVWCYNVWTGKSALCRCVIALGGGAPTTHFTPGLNGDTFKGELEEYDYTASDFGCDWHTIIIEAQKSAEKADEIETERLLRLGPGADEDAKIDALIAAEVAADLAADDVADLTDALAAMTT
jgi:hypothetical protein